MLLFMLIVLCVCFTTFGAFFILTIMEDSFNDKEITFTAIVFLMGILSLFLVLSMTSKYYTVTQYQSVDEYIKFLDSKGVNYSIRKNVLDSVQGLEGKIIVID